MLHQVGVFIYYVCEWCRDRESQLKEALNKLNSAQLNMADEWCREEDPTGIVSNIVNASDFMKCELCKNLELQLSQVLNELSLVRLIVDMLSR